MPNSLLFISNGYGEDLVAAEIAKNLLRERPDLKAAAFPLAGEGLVYRNNGIPVKGNPRAMPSGGFIHHHLGGLLLDVFLGGLIKHSFQQYRQLRRLRKEIFGVIAVGDIVAMLAARVVNHSFIFVGINKSDYYADYGCRYLPWEKRLLKKSARIVFARDELTASNLCREGINAVYLGNPMMDCLPASGEGFGIADHQRVIGILPGSRDDLFTNIEDLLPLVRRIVDLTPQGEGATFLMAVAPSFQVGRLLALEPVRRRDWSFAEPDEGEREKGILGRLVAGVGEIKIVQDSLGDVLNNSEVVLGLAGTANEQAAGMGKPVVSFPGRGYQYNRRFAEAQKQLLGEALRVVEKEALPREVWNLLLHPDLAESAGQAGRVRMGSVGAAPAIAKKIISTLPG